MTEKEENRKLEEIVEQLNRTFPHLKLYYEGEYFDDDTKTMGGKKLSYIEQLSKMECDFAPPREYSWFDVIRIINDNGLEIRWKSNSETNK